MKALVLNDTEERIKITEIEKPAPGKEQVLVRIKAAALNHRDQWCREGKYANIQYPSVLGSDGAGIVEEVFSKSELKWLGKEVVINPTINWGTNPHVQSPEFKILGMPDQGTFAEFISVSADRLHLKPEHLSFQEAAALPLGGLTAFRALYTHGQLQKGTNLLISGIGGGVAQFCLLFARSSHASIWVTSGDNHKINHSKKAGALDGFNYKNDNWISEAKTKVKGFDLIIDSVGGNQLNELIKLAKPGGKIVIYGATTGVPENLNLRALFWNQITLQGSTMGNDEEFEKMITLVNHHKIVPVVDSVKPFDEIITQFDTMKKGHQNGKLVVTF